MKMTWVEDLRSNVSNGEHEDIKFLNYDRICGSNLFVMTTSTCLKKTVEDDKSVREMVMIGTNEEVTGEMDVMTTTSFPKRVV